MSDIDLSIKLGEAFEVVLQKQYGNHRAPEAIVTPTTIKPLDALLGGGIVSSGPVLITSTPETGKSTFAYQFSSIFQKTHKNVMVIYLDIEGAGNIAESSKFRVSRIESFNIDTRLFKYEPVVFNIMEVFECVETLIDIKKKFEEKTGKEIFLLFVWDSIPATRTSKTDAAETENQVIGLKARQLGFCLEKYNPILKFNRVSFIGIDQVRANIKIDGPYAQIEKSVGTFKNMKTATNIYTLQH